MVSPGIRFNDFLFSEPKPLAQWSPPKCGGIFVVLVRDPTWAPKPFQALWFGEFGNNAQPTLPSQAWLRFFSSRHGEGLWGAALPMPFSTTSQRSTLRNELTWAYNPVYRSGEAPRDANELARKLEDLERKYEEQTAQMRLLLASMNTTFEQQPKPRRRSIGFLPSVRTGCLSPA
jgi:hypothetical protein